MKKEKILLVGDNPFNNISHLSQDRARARGHGLTPDIAADLTTTAMENGADGFLFSVSETTLTILEKMRQKGEIKRLRLFAIMPYAYEYVRLATQVGGLSGLAKIFAKRLVASKNVGSLVGGLKGVVLSDPIALMKAYLTYEIQRVRSYSGEDANLSCVMLHEVITDMALALNMEGFLGSFVDFVSRRGVTPGFNTCNFTYLVNRFREWKIDLGKVIVAAPFNKVGFQMNPSKEECEKSLRDMPRPNVIAISIMAAGYLTPEDGVGYIRSLPNILGVAVGVSKDKQARETFKLLSEQLRI
jgi:hypothetical protein